MMNSKTRYLAGLIAFLLLPYPDVIFFNLPTNAHGELSLTSTFPTGVPQGFQFWVQYFISDSVASYGFSASNAVMG